MQIQEVSKPKRNFSYVHTFLFGNQLCTASASFHSLCHLPAPLARSPIIYWGGGWSVLVRIYFPYLNTLCCGAAFSGQLKLKVTPWNPFVLYLREEKDGRRRQGASLLEKSKVQPLPTQCLRRSTHTNIFHQHTRRLGDSPPPSWVQCCTPKP